MPHLTAERIHACQETSSYLQANDVRDGARTTYKCTSIRGHLTWRLAYTFDTGIYLTRAEMKQRFRSYPFYRYATQNWGYHARTASLASPSILRLLESLARVEAAFQATKAAWLSSELPPSDDALTAEARRSITGLHCSAYFGMQTLARDLVSTQLDLNATDSDGRSPLSWAAENGHVEIARLLLFEKNGESRLTGPL